MVFDVPPAVVITTCAVSEPDGARWDGDTARVLGRASRRSHLAVERRDDLTRGAQEVRAGDLDGLAGTAAGGVERRDHGRPARVGRRCGGGRRGGARVARRRRRPAASASWRPVRGGRAGGLRRGRGRVARSTTACRSLRATRPGRPPPPGSWRPRPTRRPRAGCAGRRIAGGVTRGQGPEAGDRPNGISTARVGGPPSWTSRARRAAAAIAPRARTPGVPGGSGSPLCPCGS